jgi:hypothetical protein
LRNWGACMNAGEEYPRTSYRLRCGTHCLQHMESSEQPRLGMLSRNR